MHPAVPVGPTARTAPAPSSDRPSVPLCRSRKQILKNLTLRSRRGRGRVPRLAPSKPGKVTVNVTPPPADLTVVRLTVKSDKHADQTVEAQLVNGQAVIDVGLTKIGEKITVASADVGSTAATLT